MSVIYRAAVVIVLAYLLTKLVTVTGGTVALSGAEKTYTNAVMGLLDGLKLTSRLPTPVRAYFVRMFELVPALAVSFGIVYTISGSAKTGSHTAP